MADSRVRTACRCDQTLRTFLSGSCSVWRGRGRGDKRLVRVRTLLPAMKLAVTSALMKTQRKLAFAFSL